MRSVRSMVGLPVVENGRQLGRVGGVKLNERLDEMRGVWVNRAFAPTRYIESAQIELMGEVSVLAKSKGVRGKCEGKPMLVRALSTNGSRIGAITDAYVDLETRRVDALELSRGAWDDLLYGRRRVLQYTVRGDCVVVADQGAEGGNGT